VLDKYGDPRENLLELFGSRNDFKSGLFRQWYVGYEVEDEYMCDSWGILSQPIAFGVSSLLQVSFSKETYKWSMQYKMSTRVTHESCVYPCDNWVPLVLTVYSISHYFLAVVMIASPIFSFCGKWSMQYTLGTSVTHESFFTVYSISHVRARLSQVWGGYGS